MKNVKLQIKLLSDKARIPTRVRDTDAGYDIYSTHDAVLQPQSTIVIATDICVSAPAGYYYTIEGRSSLAGKGVIPKRAIIDATYCGHLVISLVNVGTNVCNISSGDRIAQMLLHEQIHADFEVITEFSPEYNQRGDNGFGSTGV